MTNPAWTQDEGGVWHLRPDHMPTFAGIVYPALAGGCIGEIRLRYVAGGMTYTRPHTPPAQGQFPTAAEAMEWVDMHPLAAGLWQQPALPGCEEA